MNKESKKQIQKYCSDVGKELTCSSETKKYLFLNLKAGSAIFVKKVPTMN